MGIIQECTVRSRTITLCSCDPWWTQTNLYHQKSSSGAWCKYHAQKWGHWDECGRVLLLTQYSCIHRRCNLEHTPAVSEWIHWSLNQHINIQYLSLSRSDHWSCLYHILSLCECNEEKRFQLIWWECEWKLHNGILYNLTFSLYSITLVMSDKILLVQFNID